MTEINPKTFPSLAKTIVVLFVLSIPLIFCLVTKNNQKLTTPATTPATTNTNKDLASWTKPISSDQGIPIVKNNTLYIYSLTKKQLQPTEYQTSWGSGASGFGEDNPLVSPDGSLIAFINRQDNSCLYLFPVGNQKAIKITDYSVEYLNSWSSDSSKLLFYSNQDDLAIRKEPKGMGDIPPWETVETFSKFPPGFHIFNVNHGLDTHLYPLSTAEKFIDSNRILVELSQYQENVNQTRLILFNVDTFTADYSTVNYPITSFSRQMNFSADGALWALSFDKGNTDSGVQIIFSKFPNLEGDVVDSGSWAFVQRPLLNPSGQYLAYTKRGEQIKEGKYTGQYPDKTIIWDTSSKKIIKELEGWPEYWLSENIILIGRAEYGNNPSNFTSFDLFNVATQKKETVSLNP